MRKLVWVVVCSAGMASVAMSAQTLSPAETALRDSLVKNRFILRNFSGEARVHAEWVGNALKLDTPQWHTLGVLEVQTVKFKSQQIKIYGKRRVLHRDEKGGLGLTRVAEPVQIDVDLRDEKMADALPQLKDALFFSSINEALKSIPALLQLYLLQEAPLGAKGPLKPQCDCTLKDTDACVGHPLDGGTGVKPLRQMPMLDMPGILQISLNVDESGHVTDAWIVRSLGQVADDEAARAFRQQIFRPATCHDKPMSSTILVETDTSTSEFQLSLPGR